MSPVATESTVVELRGVAKRHAGPPAVDAVHPCTLSIGKGELVAVTGPSGSGKSTLLNLLGLLDRPTAGSYLLEGVATETLSDARRSELRARHLGFVFQAFHLIGYRSPLENVALPLAHQGIPRGERLARAEECLERVGLQHRVRADPTTLSGGERQRVAIARAVAPAPTLLLCDEPTGNLDSVAAGSILDLLVDLQQAGSTVVIVTHDPTIAARAPRRLEIRDGTVGPAPR